ncbi:MAG: hypothetical protein WD690_20860 [Vicinamibacterales bacterium]
MSKAAKRPSGLLLAGWIVTLALGVASGVVVVRGTWRDTRAGEPTIPLSLGQASEYQTRSFRVWSDGQYSLFVSTVNFDRSRVGSKFSGEMQVVVRRPDGTTLLDQRFGPDTMDHVMPYNYGDTQLRKIPIGAARIRPWTVAVRVMQADPQFAGVASEVKLWRDRVDPGMGGLVTYVLIIPALMLLLLAVVLAFALARRGRRAPLVMSLIAAIAFLAAFWI